MKEKVVLKELREKESKDLYKETGELENKISELRFKAAFRKLKNYQEIKVLRKKVARIWTILAERIMLESASKEAVEK